jgi:hypothetical protein
MPEIDQVRWHHDCSVGAVNVATTFHTDLRYAARGLTRTPLWTTTLVVTIALGIASTASVDGFVRGLIAQAGVSADAEAADSIARIGRLLRVAAIAVFAIACANVAAFLLARAAARTRETAVRVAIGAGRAQLIRQVLADSVVIATAGAIAGAVLALWMVRVVPALLWSEDASQLTLAADPVEIAIVAATCAFITILCGLVPLLETRDDPGAIIQRENSGPSRASVRLGAVLVTAQMAICTLLVIATGLLLSEFRSALQTTTGRRLSHPIVASMESLQTSSKTTEKTSGLRYFDEAMRVIREETSATSITLAATVPGNRPIWQSFEFENAGLPMRELSFVSTSRTLETLVMPPVAGRLFGNLDLGPCGGVVVTPEAAREIGDPPVVGRSIETPTGWADIVGIVDVRDESVARVFHYVPSEDEAIAPPVRATYRAVRPPSEATTLDVNIVAPNYFAFMGFPIIEGTNFAAGAEPCRVAIVNQEAADRYFNGAAVGAAIIDRLGRRTTIIGVINAAKLRAVGRAVLPTVYFPIEQDFLFRMTLIAETGGIKDAMLERLHRRLMQIPGGREDKIIVSSLDDHLSRTAFAPERIATVLVGASAAIAVTLGMLGLYGLMNEAARRRRREFALRIALGGRGRHLIAQVIGEGMRLVVGGTIAGVVGSAMVAQWINRATPTDEPLSPWIWIAAPIASTLAVLMAAVLPARAALASDPLMLMKEDGP